MTKLNLYIFATILFTIAFISCRENEDFTNSTDAKLNFSTDTIHFDTIFTTIGSTTKQFKIYNRNNEGVKTTISLATKNNSYYRLNIDGQATNELVNYEIQGNDSLFIFVEVNIDPQEEDSPIVIEDSIMFYTNGNSQNVKLISYGQDVHLYNDSVIDTRTWIAGKPYLIYNSVLVDTLQTLTIEEGVQIHFHNESALWVLGTLDVQGSVENPVVFQGDRLDDYYENLPGQWWGVYRNDDLAYLTGGIHFWQGSTNNVIDHAIIKNGVKGIQVDLAPNNNPNLILSNSIIQNMSSIGLLAQSANMLVYNSVISNCGHYAVILSLGGNYEFYHSTIANYYSFDARSSEALAFNNYYFHENKYVTFDFSAIFANSIIYGDLENEFIVDQYISEENPSTFAFLFDHCMMKLDKNFSTSNEDVFKNILRGSEIKPNFLDTYNNDFRLDTLSSAKDAGSTQYLNTFQFDQDNNDRNFDGLPDLGAYERIETSEDVK